MHCVLLKVTGSTDLVFLIGGAHDSNSKPLFFRHSDSFLVDVMVNSDCQPHGTESVGKQISGYVCGALWTRLRLEAPP